MKNFFNTVLGLTYDPNTSIAEDKKDRKSGYLLYQYPGGIGFATRSRGIISMGIAV